jgi:hypothetical protein
MSAPETNQPKPFARQFAIYVATAVVLGWLVSIGVDGFYEDFTCEVFPVNGTLLVDGRVPKGAVVKLHRLDAKQWVVTTPSGMVNDEGQYQIHSIGNRRGAPAGEYIVTVQWSPEQVGIDGLEVGPNLLPRRYAAAETSPLRATVEPGVNELPTIDIPCRCTEALAAN